MSVELEGGMLLRLIESLKAIMSSADHLSEFVNIEDFQIAATISDWCILFRRS